MDDGNDLVVRTVREHASALLRTARRHSLCSDDAHDAYQRALEIFLRRASTLEPDTAVRWLHVVVKHEAQAVRRSRQQLVASEEIDLDARAADGLPDVDERVLRFDRLARSAEALERLKPQEVRALWLKAQGHSYQEIADTTGWTYTKVNRCITEGRRAFLRRYAGIEAGEECRRWAPVVSALVDGEATAEQLAAARPHLRRCAGCRATVRELRLAGPRLAGALPVAGLAGAGGAAGLAGSAAGVSARLESLARAAENAWAAVQGRAGGWALKLQQAGETASATKVAAVAASAAAIAGGGAMAVHESAPAHPRGAAHAAAAPVGSGSAVGPAAVLARAALRRGSGPVAPAAAAHAAATAGAGAAGGGREFIASAFEFPGGAGAGEFGDPAPAAARAARSGRGAWAASAAGSGPKGEFRAGAASVGAAPAGAHPPDATGGATTAAPQGSGAGWEGSRPAARPAAPSPVASAVERAPVRPNEFAGEFGSG